MSDPFLESILASFDSQAQLTWDLTSLTEVRAWFTHNGDRVTVTFTENVSGNWRISFEVTKSTQSSSELVRSSIRIFSGVFQAVEEFLIVREPERVVFASKEEGLGRLYETYLLRQNTVLHSLGYKTEDTIKAAPLAEYAIIKTTPSTW